MITKEHVDFATVVVGAASAIFWLASATVKLPKALAPATWNSAGELVGYTEKGEKVKIYPLMQKQSRLNAWAAFAAALAAAIQLGAKWAGVE